MKEKGVSAKVRIKYVTLTGKKVVQYIYTVQILQTVTLLPWSSIGDYIFNQSKKPLLSCIDLCACLMQKFNNLAILSKGPVCMWTLTKERRVM